MARGVGARGRGRKRRKGRRRPGRRWLWAGTEMAAVAAALLVAALLGLGRLADGLHGRGLWTTLVPFGAGVLVLGGGCALLLRGWLAVRGPLLRRHEALPAVAAGLVALACLALAWSPRYGSGIASLRRITDAPAEAQRRAIAHQVYAAYRRADLAAMARLLERGAVYEPAIREAADAWQVSPEVLIGIAATESSFYPRDSRDGGRGLFQITAPPAQAEAAVRERLGVRKLDPLNQRHNAHLGAATLRLYADQMHGDPFLTLLAYNIGPRNGGLRSIMEQYGATDFVTIQPYLQHLPRDYPIRVLSAALAYRVWTREHALPPYQDGDNARLVQAIGVPGLDGDLVQ